MGLTLQFLHTPLEFTSQRVQQLFLGNALVSGSPLPSGLLQLWALGTHPSLPLPALLPSRLGQGGAFLRRS